MIELGKGQKEQSQYFSVKMLTELEKLNKYQEKTKYKPLYLDNNSFNKVKYLLFAPKDMSYEFIEWQLNPVLIEGKKIGLFEERFYNKVNFEEKDTEFKYWAVLESGAIRSITNEEIEAILL